MADLLEVSERFGPTAVEVDAICVACARPITDVVVTDEVVCADCGLPVVA